MSQLQSPLPTTPQGSSGENIVPQSPACCFRYTLYYQEWCIQLQRALQDCQKELETERKAAELLKQDFLTLNECHSLLENAHQQQIALTNEIEKRAGGIINELQARMQGTAIDQPESVQSISSLIVESARYAVLLRLEGRPRDDAISQLNRVMGQNLQLQQRCAGIDDRYKELKKSNKTLESENANLQQALKLTTQDQRRGKPRRAKTKRRETPSSPEAQVVNQSTP